jgi:hypothetical protein
VTTSAPDELFGSLDPLLAGLQRRLGIWVERYGSFRKAAWVLILGWGPIPLIIGLERLFMQGASLAPFAFDFGVHSRALVAAPVLVLAEAVCFPQLSGTCRHFLDAGLIAPSDRLRFDEILASTRRLGVSRWARLAAVSTAYACIVVLVTRKPHVPAWQLATNSWLAPFSLAGWYHALVTLPMLLVLLLYWLWRVFLWTRLLWKVSGLELRLIPAHPDHAAGLKFLGYSVRAFAPVGFALGAVVAGTLANGVMQHGVVSVEFRNATIGVLSFSLLLFSAPVLVFTRPLAFAWMRGIYQYGALANGVGRRFERRWLGKTRFSRSVLSIQDFSAINDLYQCVGNTYAMKVVLVDFQAVIFLAVATLLPLGIVALCSLPVEVIGRAIADLLF